MTESLYWEHVGNVARNAVIAVKQKREPTISDALTVVDKPGVRADAEMLAESLIQVA